MKNVSNLLRYETFSVIHSCTQSDNHRCDPLKFCASVKSYKSRLCTKCSIKKVRIIVLISETSSTKKAHLNFRLRLKFFFWYHIADFSFIVILSLCIIVFCLLTSLFLYFLLRSYGLFVLVIRNWPAGVIFI